jgi:hypothetical protein
MSSTPTSSSPTASSSSSAVAFAPSTFGATSAAIALGGPSTPLGQGDPALLVDVGLCNLLSAAEVGAGVDGRLVNEPSRGDISLTGRGPDCEHVKGPRLIPSAILVDQGGQTP